MSAKRESRERSAIGALTGVSDEFLDRCPTLIWIKDQHLRYRYVNDAHVDVFRCDADALIGEDDYHYLPESTADQLRANDRQVLGTGRPIRVTEDARDADGVLRRWLVHKFPLARPGGETWIAGMASEITEWLSAEQDQRESEENYRRLVEASPYCITEIDREGLRLTVNSAGLRMLDAATADEVLNEPIIHAVAEHERERVAPAMSRALRGEPVEVEYETTTAKFFRSSFVPIFDHARQVTSLLGITQDITRRKEADDRLRMSEERYRLIAMAAQDPIWESDLTTGITTRNEAYEALCGVGPSDREESWAWWEKHVHEEDRERASRSLRAAIDDPAAERWAEDYRYVDRNGQELFVQDRAFISRREDGTPLRILGTMRNQTPVVEAMRERQRLLEDVREAQRFESLGVLAGGVAHDFNNLLTVMMGNVHVLRQGGSADAEPLDELQRAVDSASKICQQMLTFAGKERLEARPLRLSALVHEIHELLRASINRSINLELDMSGDERQIMGDEAQLSQLVMNLAANAAESIGAASGRVVLRVSDVTIDTDAASGIEPRIEPGNYVCLEVADTGAGMDDATMRKIFDPFYTTKFTGRGMGLAAVQGIIRSHGGGLSVESDVGVGSTFRVWLPGAAAAMPEREKPKAPVPADAAVAQGSVLIIDDEEQVRRSVRRCLDVHGFEAHVAVDGIEGVRMFAAQPSAYDVILLDLTMPHMDGVETLRRIRDVDASIPVIMMSGYGEAQCVDRLAGLPADGYLKKPFAFPTLVDLIADRLKR